MKSRKYLVGAVAAALMAGVLPTSSHAQAGTQFIAQISYFGFNYCPVGWTRAEGQILPIAPNAALFSLVGTTYGGNGTTSFQLPDLRGRRNLGQGSMPGGGTYTLGAVGGQENVVLLTSQLPQHTHQLGFTGPPKLPTSSQLEDTNLPDGNSSPTYAAGTMRYKTGVGDQTGMGIDESLILANTGGSMSHYNVPPFQVVTACIATDGIFPSRN